MRYVTVRVVNSGGRPESNAKVTLWVGGIAGGFLTPEYTNSDGEADFKLDDAYSEISISVNDRERVPRASVRADYKIVI